MMRHLPLVLACLTASGCMIPLTGVTPNGDKPAVPTPPPVAPVVAGVPVNGAGGPGSVVLRAKQSSVELGLGEDRPLGALVVDGNGLVQTTGVIWVSTNPSVLTVNPTSGEAKALAAGTAVVIATSQANPAAQAQIEVKVTEKQLVKQIVVDPANLSLEDGGKKQLAAQVYMADGTINGNVTWASSDDTIATVSAAGEVRARKEGKVTIEAIYALDPRFKGIAVLTVGNPPATTTPATGGTTVTPGTAPGEELVPAAPKGKWVAQVLDGISRVENVWFRDDENGLLQAAEGLFATADAGTTWTPLAVGEADPKVGALAWFDADQVIGLGGSGVRRSTDGGATWTTIPLGGEGYSPYRLQVVGPQEAYALNIDLDPYRYYANVVMHTEDGGATWERETWEHAPKQNVAGVVRAGDTLVALTEGGIYTLDPAEGGWSKAPVAFKAQFAMMYVNSIGAIAGVPGTKTVVVAGPDGTMRSTDAGKTWNVVPGTALAGVHALSFADAEHGLAIGQHEAWTTNDGGKTWDVAAELTKSTAVRDGSRQYTGARLSTARGYVVRYDNKLFRFVYP